MQLMGAEPAGGQAAGVWISGSADDSTGWIASVPSRLSRRLTCSDFEKKLGVAECGRCRSKQ